VGVRLGTLLVLLGLSALSVLWRARRKARQQEIEELPEEPLPSPVADAIKELVGVAGGIYLALILLKSLLSINLPDLVTVWNVSFDPLALTALILAIVQPAFTGRARRTP